MFKKHPKGMVVLFLIEMWERFGFYIMTAVYVLYMEKTLKFDDSEKGLLYGLFLAAAYLFPLAGGWLGDKIIGQIQTIRIGIGLMMFGYIGLAVSSQELVWPFFAGLISVAVGTGIFKVNMSVLVGNLYRDKVHLKDAGFNIYYMGVNVGATIGPLTATILGALFESYNISFWAASAGMLISAVSLEGGKHYLAEADTRSKEIKEHINNQAEMSSKETVQRIITLIVLFLIAALFWVPFYQNGMALTLFADRSTIPYKFLRPETYVMFNAVFILILTPPLLLLFSKMRERNLEPSTPVKIFTGLLIMGGAMGIMALASVMGGNLDQPVMSPLWLISTYLFITLAEIMISPMGQSYVSKVAPPKIQGLMMGGWFGSTALGALSSGIFGRFYSTISHDLYFLLLAGLSVFAALMVLVFMRKLKRFAE
jgi:POT family proton-dependent oligopeptide transporter